MANKIKVIGYAKKEFYTDGIEYRNFSPDLVGNQLTSNGGTALFTAGNFNVTTNLDGKVSKNFVTNDFGDFMTLDDLILTDSVTKKFTNDNVKAKLNLDNTNVLNHAFFGSLKEYVRVSLENIIINWPASLYVTSYSPVDPTLSGLTVLNHNYDSSTNQTTITVDTERINNLYNINYLTNGTILGTFNESNDLRNLTLNYSNYVISNKYGDFPVVLFSGASAITNSILSFTVTGKPFPLISIENIPFHIKPNEYYSEGFFIGLNDFENNLLNRFIIPKYTAQLKVYNEMDSGAIIESTKLITWPVTDGYNIDFNTSAYSVYVDELILISESNDATKSDLMSRFLVSKSISEFDTVTDIDGSYEGADGQKMTSTLKIYGREFDEIKKYSDGIAFANVVTYNKKNNTPDSTVKILARILGWDLTSSLSEVNLVENFLTPKTNNFDGLSRGLTDTEAEVELWRRIILNTPWLWKSKGTRKAIEFLFKFIGAPDGLITFNEYIYVAENVIDMDNLRFLMNFFNGSTDVSELNVDDNGFPKVLPNNLDMYFQKAGLWYRITGGPAPDIDILYGNNPHFGPYDGGQAYIDQFGNCLIPNFEPTRQVDYTYESNTNNLFTNYNGGSFNECCEGNIVAIVNTDIDFSGILANNIAQFLSENTSTTESGCTITSDWTFKAYLGGNIFYTNVFVSGSTAPTVNDYINELNILTGMPELSGTTGTTSGDTYIFVDDYSDCNADLLDEYLKIELCIETTFDCIDEGIAPDANITGDNAIICDVPLITLSTISTSATWSPYTLVNNGPTLTWEVSGDVTPFTEVIDYPTFDLSLNTGTVNMYIYDLSQVSDFVMFNNQEITYVDLQYLTTATYISVDSNLLTTVDISNNIAVENFGCNYNMLDTLDVSLNINLTHLQLNGNNVQVLSITNNPLLTFLSCHNNNMSSSIVDQIFIDLDTFGLSGGYLSIRNNRTTLSDSARANLITKGWTISDTYTT